MDNKVKELQEKLRTKRPERWELIPDIDLYMDQIAAYMMRQHIGLADDDNDEALTSAMINNYIKSGILPRANGKKYDKDHIVYLTAICLLKQVVSVSDTGALLSALLENQTTQELYGNYAETEDHELRLAADLLDGISSRTQMAETALKLAVSSYAQKYACKKLIDMLKSERQDGSQKTKKAKKHAD